MNEKINECMSERFWSVGGMIQAGERQSTWRKTTDSTWTGLPMR